MSSSYLSYVSLRRTSSCFGLSVLATLSFPCVRGCFWVGQQGVGALHPWWASSRACWGASALSPISGLAASDLTRSISSLFGSRDVHASRLPLQTCSPRSACLSVPEAARVPVRDGDGLLASGYCVRPLTLSPAGCWDGGSVLSHGHVLPALVLTGRCRTAGFPPVPPRG